MMQHPEDSEIQVSEDGYWKFVEGSWIPTELQLNALAQALYLMIVIPQYQRTKHQRLLQFTHTQIVKKNRLRS